MIHSCVLLAADAVELTDRVAAKSDRWLFIGALVLLGIFAMTVMKYFVRQHERLVGDHQKAREIYQASLERIVDAQFAQTREVTAAITRNSDVILRNTEAINRAKEFLTEGIQEMKFVHQQDKPT